MKGFRARLVHWIILRICARISAIAVIQAALLIAEGVREAEMENIEIVEPE